MGIKKGKTFEEFYGIKKAKEIKKKLRESHKGQIPVWKGIPMLEKRKEWLSDYWINKYKNGYIHPNIGRKISEEQIGKMKNTIRNNGGSKLKGKTFEERFGKEKALEIKKKSSKRLKGKKLHKNAIKGMEIYHTKIKGKNYEEIHGIDKGKKIKDKIKKSFTKDLRKRISERVSKRKGDLSPNWKGGLKEVNCKECGKIILRSDLNIFSRENIFCNKECHNKYQIGKNSYSWKGGISFEPYGLDWTREFRRAIRNRDNQVCMLCGIHREKLSRALDVHHINYNKQDSTIENCISLCNSCHIKTNINRKHWTKFFQDLLHERYNYTYSK